MENKITSYIDKCVISEHVTKTEDGYSLFVDDLPNYERENLIEYLMQNDQALRDLVLDHAQELINQRLPEIESQQRFDSHYSS